MHSELIPAHATGGRVFVLGIFLGLIICILASIQSVTTYLQWCVNAPSDPAIFPNDLYKFMTRTLNYVNDSSWIIGIWSCAFSLYVCV